MKALKLLVAIMAGAMILVSVTSCHPDTRKTIEEIRKN
jgi:hypothetical protein